MEQRIKDLCEELITTDDPEQLKAVSAELQELIHDRIEELRRKLLEVPASLPSAIVPLM